MAPSDALPKNTFPQKREFVELNTDEGSVKMQITLSLPLKHKGTKAILQPRDFT